MNSSRGLRMLAVLAVVFGALTIFSGGRALFGGEQAQAAVGNAVGFVLWFNFLAGFAYVLTGAGLWQGRRWAVAGAGLLALATSLVVLAFGLHVVTGGAFEMRTVGALGVRLAFWTLVFAVGRRASKATP
ncbi:MAG: hypothetical protein K9J76_09145 [Polaromonas sp.]|nr:hypothetical protein [Polaromonas sp.]